MTRAVRYGVLLAATVLLLAGCSDDDPEQGAAGSTTTSAAVAEESTTTLAGAVPATSGASPSVTNPTTGGGAPTTSAAQVTTTPTPASSATGPGTTATSGAAGPAVATAAGWRLAVTQPVSGGTIGTSAELCYEVTGNSREPEVLLEVAVLGPGGATAAGPFAVEGAVGRGTARVTLTGATPGRYDLRVQLVINGERFDGGAVTIPAVTVVQGAAQAGPCA